MAYTSININFNENTLCEEISFSEPGEQTYVIGSIITLSDPRLGRSRDFIVTNINYTENESGGLITTVSGFSTEYSYTRKAPSCDVSFFTMTMKEYTQYRDERPSGDSQENIRFGDEFGALGWSMHTVVAHIAVLMGLTVYNTLPNFCMSEFIITVGTTFFEAILGLVSEFEPVITVNGSVLYLLERSSVGLMGGSPWVIDKYVNLSMDLEHAPLPGCIKVEGQEGRYLSYKDPSYNANAVVELAKSYNAEYSGRIDAPDGSSEVYSIKEKHLGITVGETVLTDRTQKTTLTDAGGYVSYSEITASINYSWSKVIESESETCATLIDGNVVIYNSVSTTYEHDILLNLRGQLTVKKELFILDSDDGSYTKYDPRDYVLVDLAACETYVLMPSEIRTTKYTRINSEAYGVETIIASKMWNVEREDWQTSYTFEHDIVEAGNQQKYIPLDIPKSMQVYAGSCSIGDNLSIMPEPPRIFSFPTPSWSGINNCYLSLVALFSSKFKRIQITVPIIDPVPLMKIDGLGLLVHNGVLGYPYVIGYSINIDPKNGYTTELILEARYV